MMQSIKLADGKYTYHRTDAGTQYADRQGAEWRDCTGDNLVAELAESLDEALVMMKEFCERVEAGEVRSRKTYAKFKIFLARHGRDSV